MAAAGKEGSSECNGMQIVRAAAESAAAKGCTSADLPWLQHAHRAQ